MHLLLVDQMTCPRCGPEFGLILLADKMKERRVLDGQLGCSNCRSQYPLVDGCGDLRVPFLSDPSEGFLGVSGELPKAMEIAALLGLTGGYGNVGLIGNLSGGIRDLIEITTNFEFVGIHHENDDLSVYTAIDRENGIICGPRLPFRNECFRGVVVSGREKQDCMMEVVRILASNGRLAVWESTLESRDFLLQLGLKILMKQRGIAVWERS